MIIYFIIYFIIGVLSAFIVKISGYINDLFDIFLIVLCWPSALPMFTGVVIGDWLRDKYR